MGELDSGRAELLLDHLVDQPPQHELLARDRLELDPHDHRRVVELPHALALEVVQHDAVELLVLAQPFVDALDDLAHLLEVGVEAQADVELHDDVVAREVGHGLQVAEGNGVDLPPRVTQADGAQREVLDASLGGARLDVVPDPEGVVDQEEDPGDDVPHERLGPEADGEPDHPGAGDERADVHPDRGEHDQGDDHEEHRRDELAQQDEQRPGARAAGAALLVVVVGGRHLQAQLRVDAGLGELPGDEAEGEGDDDAQDVRGEDAPDLEVQAPEAQHREEEEGREEQPVDLADQRRVELDVAPALGRRDLAHRLAAQVDHLGPLAGGDLEQPLAPLVQAGEDGDHEEAHDQVGDRDALPLQHPADPKPPHHDDVERGEPVPPARQHRPQAGGGLRRRGEGRRHPGAAFPDHDEQRRRDEGPAQAVDRKKERRAAFGLGDHAARTAEQGAAEGEDDDPAVHEGGVAVRKREEPPAGGAGGEHDLGGRREQHDVAGGDEEGEEQGVGRLVRVIEEGEGEERCAGEDRRPRRLPQQVGGHPGEKPDPPPAHGLRHPRVEARRPAQDEPPQQDPAREDRRQREKRAQKLTGSPAAGHPVDDLADSVALGLRLRFAEERRELALERRHRLGEAGEERPDRVEPPAGEDRAAARRRRGPGGRRRRVLQHLRERAAGLRIGQGGEEGIGLLGGEGQRGQDHLLPLRLGLRGLGLGEFLRVGGGGQNEKGPHQESGHPGAAVHRHGGTSLESGGARRRLI